MVSLLSVFARSEDKYDMHFVPLRARCFCTKAPGKDIDFVPLGAVVLVLGCTCNRNVTMAWA